MKQRYNISRIGRPCAKFLCEIWEQVSKLFLEQVRKHCVLNFGQFQTDWCDKLSDWNYRCETFSLKISL